VSVTGERPTPVRRPGAAVGGLGRGPGAMMGGPAEKALDFKGSGARMLRMLRPH
jgi:ATP-binding cassette subfamily B multidrug efflux pump